MQNVSTKSTVEKELSFQIIYIKFAICQFYKCTESNASPESKDWKGWTSGTSYWELTMLRTQFWGLSLIHNSRLYTDFTERCYRLAMNYRKDNGDRAEAWNILRGWRCARALKLLFFPVRISLLKNKIASSIRRNNRIFDFTRESAMLRSR